MKLFYIMLNLFLFIVVVVLFALNLTFKAHGPDKILSMAPDLSRAVPSAQKTKNDKEEITDIAGLWDNNLFSQYRSGEGGSILGGAKPTGLELLGISIFGDVSGAVILDKQTGAASPLPGRLRSTRGAGAVPAATQNVPTFYKLGDRLDNGFILSEVNSDSVVLSRGREQIVLKIDYDDEGSVTRAAEVPPPPVVPVAPPVPENPPDTEAPPASPGAPGASGNRTDGRMPVAVTPDESGTTPQPVTIQRPSRFRPPPPPRPDQ